MRAPLALHDSFVFLTLLITALDVQQCPVHPSYRETKRGPPEQRDGEKPDVAAQILFERQFNGGSLLRSCF